MSEIRSLDSTIDAGSWSGSHTDVEVIGSANDDTNYMSCIRMNVGSTCKLSIQNTTYSNVASLTLRGRLRYEGGVGQATIYIKDSGGSTIGSKVCSVTGSYTTFSETLTGPWSQATFNGFEYWVTFDDGDTPGVNDIRLTAGEVEAFDVSGSPPAVIATSYYRRKRTVGFLKQSTAVTLRIGPFVDATDAVTAEDSLTIAQADVRLSKNHGAFAQKNESTSCTHDENGWYQCPLNTTDTGTLGLLQIAVSESGALPVFHEFTVLPANVYDSIVSGSDYLQADAVQIEGGDASDAINAQVVDCLNVDTYAEPGQGTPAATTTLVYKIGLLYKALRNKKLQTSSQFSLLADDATTVDHKATVGDDGTETSIGELATGP